MASLNAGVGADAFELLEGADHIGTWTPDGGNPKSFCRRCGGHLYSGDPTGDGTVWIRIGALEDDPGIRPRWRQWLSSAPEWYPIPDDGLPRFGKRREIDL